MKIDHADVLFIMDCIIAENKRELNETPMSMGEELAASAGHRDMKAMRVRMAEHLKAIEDDQYD